MTHEQKLEKVRKLLTLANNNTNEEEAQTAMLMAQKLMAQWKIDEESVTEITEKDEMVDTMYSDTRGDSLWKHNLARVIAKNFKCKNFRRYMFNSKKGYLEPKVAFIGFKDDVEIAVAVFNYAVKYGYYGCGKFYRKCRAEGMNTVGIGEDYFNGFVAAIKEKFEEQVAKNQWGLMIVPDKKVLDEYTALGLVTKAKKNHGQGNHEAIMMGYMDGKLFDKDTKQIQ